MGFIDLPGGRVDIPDVVAAAVVAALGRLLAERVFPLLVSFDTRDGRTHVLVGPESGLRVVQSSSRLVVPPRSVVDALVKIARATRVLSLDVAAFDEYDLDLARLRSEETRRDQTDRDADQ